MQPGNLKFLIVKVKKKMIRKVGQSVGYITIKKSKQ
jgi:hypothetical protein